MGERKITILDEAVQSVAEIAFYIESEGLPETAKRFVDEAFLFFETLTDEKVVHRPCRYLPWYRLQFRCANFRKKYIVGYLNNTDEIIICTFELQKLLVE